MKYIKGTILLLILIMVLPVMAAAASPAVYLDGQALHFEVEPVIENNRVQVPLRAIFEAMGANVIWEPESQTARAVKGDTTVVLQMGNTSPTVNGQVKTLDVPARIMNGRILAPLRFVGESFGGTVAWNQAANRIDIAAAANGTNSSQEQAILSITGDKVKAAMNYRLSDLQGMTDIIITDSYYSRGKAKENWAAAAHNTFTGVSLAALLEQKVGLKAVPGKVKIKAEDGYTLMLSWEEVKAAYLDETNPDKKLTTILAWSQDGKANPPTGGSCLRLIIGQKYEGDFNRQRWVHSVNSITVE
ncbi:MAG: stalk domain-containing protein [Methanobacterium sp.]